MGIFTPPSSFNLCRNTLITVPLTVTSPVASTLITRHLPDLANILTPGVTLCALERPPTEAFLRALQTLTLPSQLVLRGAPETLAPTLLAQLAQSAKGCPDVRAWVADIAQWVDVFATLLEPSAVGLRLAEMHHPMCPAFHTDEVGIRLVCAYLGPGTEYLNTEDADPTRLGYHARGETLEESGLLLPGAKIQQAPSQAVLLMKGATWPGNEATPLIHRSPCLTPYTRRVVLTLDAC